MKKWNTSNFKPCNLWKLSMRHFQWCIEAIFRRVESLQPKKIQLGSLAKFSRSFTCPPSDTVPDIFSFGIQTKKDSRWSETLYINDRWICSATKNISAVCFLLPPADFPPSNGGEIRPARQFAIYWNFLQLELVFGGKSGRSGLVLSIELITGYDPSSFAHQVLAGFKYVLASSQLEYRRGVRAREHERKHDGDNEKITERTWLRLLRGRAFLHTAFSCIIWDRTSTIRLLPWRLYRFPGLRRFPVLENKI